MNLTDPNSILHGKTMMLFAALYLDIIYPVLDASERAAAQMTDVDSHNGEDSTPDAMEEQYKEQWRTKHFHVTFKARNITHPIYFHPQETYLIITQ